MARSYDIAILSQKVEQMEGKIVANDVIANPTGETSGDLTSIQIDGVKLNVPHTADKITYNNTNVDSFLNLISGNNLSYCYGESFGLEIDAYSRVVNKSITIPSNDGNIIVFPSVTGSGTWSIGDFSYTLSGTSLSVEFTITRPVAAEKQTAFVSLLIRYKAPTQTTTSTRSKKKKEEN